MKSEKNGWTYTFIDPAIYGLRGGTLLENYLLNKLQKAEEYIKELDGTNDREREERKTVSEIADSLQHITDREEYAVTFEKLLKESMR